MPEYLAPGVYVEETSFRAKSIEGVATSTAGFVGQCLFGPQTGAPTLITSFEEFKRYFGGLDDLLLGGVATPNYLAHAVRHFFENGGKRVYVARVSLNAGTAAGAPNGLTAADGDTTNVTLTARSAGLAGDLRVRISGARGRNAWTNGALTGLRSGDMVEITTAGAALDPVVGPNGDPAAADYTRVYWADIDDSGTVWLRHGDAGGTDGVSARIDASSLSITHAHKLTVSVLVGSGERVDAYTELSTHPGSADYIGRILRLDDPPDRSTRIHLAGGEVGTLREKWAVDLYRALVDVSANQDVNLAGGTDGDEITSTEITGGGTGAAAWGLGSLGEVDDIAIIAAPGGSGLSSDVERQAVRNALISHCENLKYRFAILSAARDLDTASVRDVRAEHDSKYAALYYPWVVIKDPNGQSGDLLSLPPDGFMAGIYARSDIERGVHKAPANEIVRGAIKFHTHVNKGTQDVLNPEGINALRFMEGRGYRVWGGRTISSDPEWKYVNVRRLFIYLEHSIDLNTQWAVFEPNNESLWLKVRMTIESFLLDVWRTGALLGSRPEDAFFVRCDRSTMTQSDLDNGRLICLIGVAPTKPAEFVIFRIGQWTADASII